MGPNLKGSVTYSPLLLLLLLSRFSRVRLCATPERTAHHSGIEIESSGSVVKNPPANAGEMQVRSLGREGPLE